MSSKASASTSTVCIIIAAYNAGSTIEKAIRSAQEQDYVSEIVVVDDASSDDTVHRVSAMSLLDPRISLIRHQTNEGPSAARNHAIAASKSDWIGILDADDFFVGQRITQLLAFAKNNDLIADDLWQVGQDEPLQFSRRLLNRPLNGAEAISFDDFVLGNISDRKERGELGFIKPLMRRAFLETHAIRYQEHMRLGEDYELYARALAAGARMVLLPPKGYVSVVRPNSLSGRHTEIDLRNLRDCNLVLGEIAPLTSNQRSALKKHYISIDKRLQWRNVISAVKTANIYDFFASYFTSWPVFLYVTGQLFQQLVERGLSRIGFTAPRSDTHFGR